MTERFNSRNVQILVLAALIGLPNVRLVGVWQANVADRPAVSNRFATLRSSFLVKTQDGPRARNSRQQLPQTEAAAVQAGWHKMPDWANAFHRRGAGNENNKKYLPPRDGSVDLGLEAIFDKDGNLVTDKVNGGTYNYVAPAYPGDNTLVFAIRGTGHFAVDVLPYLALGNSRS